MRVHIEQTRTTCDHCGELKQGIILSAEFAEQVNDSIQLCVEDAEFLANEILRLVRGV
jgi:hypothetical protein